MDTMAQGGRMLPQILTQWSKTTFAPPLSDGVTVYSAAEIRSLTNLSAGQHSAYR